MRCVVFVSRIGLCAIGTDTVDCADGTRERRIEEAYYDEASEEIANVGKCTWISQKQLGQDQGTCAWAPDKGCVRWEQITEELISPSESAEVTGELEPMITAASTIARAIETTAAARRVPLTDPTPATWFDSTGWTLAQLTGAFLRPRCAVLLCE
jgi:hypothetical protein